MTHRESLTEEQQELLKKLYFEAAEDLINELEKMINKDEKTIFIGGLNLSVNDLIKHIRDMTEVGVEHVKMHIQAHFTIVRFEQEKRKKSIFNRIFRRRK